MILNLNPNINFFFSLILFFLKVNKYFDFRSYNDTCEHGMLKKLLKKPIHLLHASRRETNQMIIEKENETTRHLKL